jgi:hypothetical protein
MQPTNIAGHGTAPSAHRLHCALVRVGMAVGIVLSGASALSPAAAAQSTTQEPQTAEASNGGVASTSSDGTVEIGEIVTGENTGNSIVTGDIAGSADLHGGEIGYPTEINVTLIVEPSIATASGGDTGEATTTPDDGNKDSKDGNDDITIINRNDNRSKAKTVEVSGD